MITAWADYTAGLAAFLLLATSSPFASLRRGVLWFLVAACSASSAVAFMVASRWLPAATNSATAVVAGAGWLHWRAARKRAAG